MNSLIRHLSHDKKVALMLLISSLVIGICALTPALFVIIVLNKYLASGITATLISLTAGAVLALGFEFTFRQNRSIMMQEFNQKIYDPLLFSPCRMYTITPCYTFIQAELSFGSSVSRLFGTDTDIRH